MLLCVFLTLVSFLTNWQILSAILVAIFIFTGKKRFKILKFSFLATSFFTLTVLISYALYSYFLATFSLNYFLHTFFRTLTMSYAVFWFIASCNLYKAFSFSKDFSFLLALTMSKILRLQKLYFEFLEVLKARGALNNRLSYEFLGSTITMFLTKALHDGIENAEAMKMRGLDV